ncbi:hypothetical protein JVT61DRAFT_4934 [Boletus reticuloceps]|uniref:DUF6534 domain-containing protein n=1 Tax=Boletus reticuloceps TaxID=495285 RepID=A0A8I3AFL8_9AGAM|nr:hypothetical protein JVT61DRAFT_4934 [Boletus reticuloceps]
MVGILLLMFTEAKPSTSGGQTLSYVSLSLAAAVDILIAMAMTFLLLRTRSMTGIADTAHILQRLTVFAVNTGIWTATFAVLAVVFLRLFPPSVLYFVLFGIPLSSLYCNTLLANLNARAYIRSGKMTPVFDGTMAENHSEMVFASSTHQKTTEVGTSTNAAGSTAVEDRV